MKKKVIPVLIAVVLIIVIAAIGVFPILEEQFAYSSDQADITDYFENTLPELMYKEYQARSGGNNNFDELYGITVSTSDITGKLKTGGENALLFIQNELYPYQTGIIRDGGVYLPYEFVCKYLTNRFYFNDAEACLKFTTPNDVQTVYLNVDPTTVEISSPDLNNPDVTRNSYDYPILIKESDKVYLAAQYLTSYASFSYEAFEDPSRIQILTREETLKAAVLKKDQAIRIKAGPKCEVLTKLKKGDTVYLTEGQFFDEWALVMTKDCFLGYIEYKDLEDATDYHRSVSATASPMVYPSITRDHKICLGWHQMLSQDTSTFDSYTQNTTGMNVISPTWLYVTGDEGGLTDISSSDYVSKAHAKGLEVWVLADDFTKENSLNALLGNTTLRLQLANNLVNAVLKSGADGLNIDFEKISSDNGDNFAQFLRELSILTHKNNIVLSVDNYPPSGGWSWYRRDEQGIVCDYVIVMGYDEHWAGGNEAGSVASINYVERGIADTIAQGVPAEKLINAVPFFTRIWQTEGTTVGGQTVSMGVSQEWLANHSLTPEWDETTCQNYASLQSGTALFEVWLEDTASLQVKLTIMQKYNISGIACWKLGLENNDVWPLINAYLGL
ncbi:MAG: glycosyl hydrolase family 18 [Lachnospiraceae bacterium]|nr:glycosyl hydrolase family 18 [Candidatus Merdinaster equi]